MPEVSNSSSVLALFLLFVLCLCKYSSFELCLTGFTSLIYCYYNLGGGGKAWEWGQMFDTLLISVSELCMRGSFLHFQCKNNVDSCWRWTPPKSVGADLRCDRQEFLTHLVVHCCGSRPYMRNLGAYWEFCYCVIEILNLEVLPYFLEFITEVENTHTAISHLNSTINQLALIE